MVTLRIVENKASMSGKETRIGWNITYSTKARKQFDTMPEKIRERMTVLAKEISVFFNEAYSGLLSLFSIKKFIEFFRIDECLSGRLLGKLYCSKQLFEVIEYNSIFL